MSILSDISLRARLESLSDTRLRVEPLAEDAIQPASVDVRLGNSVLVREYGVFVDPLTGRGPAWINAPGDAEVGWMLIPGRLYLGALLEFVQVPNDLLCHLHGRSSLAREGITVHQQAGLLDPGYRGHPTLEITVTHATRLSARMPIGQLTFERLTTPAERPYGDPALSSRYQNDAAPTPARLKEARP